MPGPLKTSAVNTTGLKIGKDIGKLSRDPQVLPNKPPSTGNDELDLYIDQLRSQVQDLTKLVNDHENKLNHMQVDPITHVVTFIV